MQSLSGELRKPARGGRQGRPPGPARPGARSALVVLAVRDARAHPSAVAGRAGPAAAAPRTRTSARRPPRRGGPVCSKSSASPTRSPTSTGTGCFSPAFLAENDLLIEPDSGVAVSLTDCEELARERGQDCWTVAGRFAERMLPPHLPQRRPRPRGPPGARDPAGARAAAGVRCRARRLRGARLAGLDLPVSGKPSGKEGRQQERRQDRRGRAAGG